MNPQRWPGGTPRTPDALCPHCGYELDAASPTSHPDTAPSPGDFSVCACCAAVLRFGEDLRPRALEFGELEREVHADPALGAALTATQNMVRLNPMGRSRRPRGSA